MSQLITHHPSLVSLGRRVRARFLLDRVRAGLPWALAGAAVLSLGGRLSNHPEWQVGVVVWVVLVLVASLLLALRRWPSNWAVAVAADGLGLSERVASAIYAMRTAHPAASLLEADAVRALARVNPSSYPLLPSGRTQRVEAAAAAALILALLLPLPAVGDAGRQAAEERSVAAARESLRRIEARLAVQPEPLSQAAAEQLKVSEERLAEARTAAEAARLLEQAQERLAGQGKAEDYAWQRALEGLAAAWSQNAEVANIARAISAGDQEAAEKALADLARRAGEMSAEDRQSLQQALQSGANSARDVPELAGALREAASELARSGQGTQPQGGTPRTMGNAASQVVRGMARSAGLQSVQQAVAALGLGRAGLGRVSGTAAGSTSSAAGAPTGSAPDGQATGGDGRGQGSGPGSTGSGSGSGSGTGSGRGNVAGGGAGAGAGAGGEPARGQPGGTGAGATMAGGNAAPSLRGTTAYESIYAPSLMGGSG